MVSCSLVRFYGFGELGYLDRCTLGIFVVVDYARGLSFTVSFIHWRPNWFICEVCSVWFYFLGHIDVLISYVLFLALCYFPEEHKLIVVWSLTGFYSCSCYVFAGG